MAYRLNSTTIKSPSNVSERPREISVKHTTINGQTKKHITRRKREWVLTWRTMKISDYNALKSIYDLQVPVNFEVTDANYTVAPVRVHLEMNDRDFLKGPSYLAVVSCTLIEV